MNLQKLEELKKDIQLIKSKIEENKIKGITDSFKLELILLEELPDQYDQYPWLIKRLTKSDDDSYLNKFLESLENVALGKSSLAATELKLGTELKKQFIDPILEKNNLNK